MKAIKRFNLPLVILVAAGLLINACGPLQHSLIQVTDPHDGNTFPLNQSITIRANVADISHYTNWDWVSYEYYIMDGDTILAHVGNETIRQRNLYVQMNTPLEGVHYVSVRARAARPDPDFADVPNNPYRVYSDWINSNEVCFYVGPNPPPDFCTTRTIAQPIQAATATPTPFPPTPIPVIDNAQAYPSPIYYGETCPSLSSVTFRAALTLPQGVTPDLTDVKAHVSVMVGSSGNNSGSLLVPLQSNGTWDAASGGQVFLGTIALTHSYNDASNHFDLAALGGGNGALLWYVDASSHDPSNQNAVYLGRTLNQVISLSPCPTSSQNPQHHPNSGNGPASGCSQYTNQVSCNLGGCSWDPQNSSCSVSP